MRNSVVMVVALLAGCSTPPFVEETVGPEPVTGLVEHTVACGQTLVLGHTMERTAGDIVVTIRDGARSFVGRDTWNGRESLEPRTYTGSEGNWTLGLDRFGFVGSYRITVDCPAKT